MCLEEFINWNLLLSVNVATLNVCFEYHYIVFCMRAVSRAGYVPFPWILNVCLTPGLWTIIFV